MEKLVFVLLVLCTLSTAAFGKGKIDSVYYLMDTVKTPIYDRMWDVHEEYPSVKLYIIKCSCLQYDNQPTFVYDMRKDKDEIVSRKELQTFKFISLTNLIAKAKQISSDKKEKHHYTFFLAEPVGEKYVLRKVRLLNPTQSPQTNKDYITVPGDDSTKLIKQ